MKKLLRATFSEETNKFFRSVKNLGKEVAGQEDPLTSFFKFASIKCKEYTSERKNQIIKIVFDEIMKE